MVVDGLSEKIDDVLLTACTVSRSNILLGEHSTLFIGTLLLHSDDHIV